MSVTRAATPAASALVRAAALLTVAVAACHDTTTAPSRITPADTPSVVNAWASGNVDNPVSLNYHTATVTTTAVLNDVVTYLSRNNPKSDVTGFNLTGFGATTVTGTIPVPSPTVTHTTDQLPAYYDANGNLVLYLGGDNKAILSVTLLDSVGGLFVNGVALPITTTF